MYRGDDLYFLLIVVLEGEYRGDAIHSGVSSRDRIDERLRCGKSKVVGLSLMRLERITVAEKPLPDLDPRSAINVEIEVRTGKPRALKQLKCGGARDKHSCINLKLAERVGAVTEVRAKEMVYVEGYADVAVDSRVGQSARLQKMNQSCGRALVHDRTPNDFVSEEMDDKISSRARL